MPDPDRSFLRHDPLAERLRLLGWKADDAMRTCERVAIRMHDAGMNYYDAVEAEMGYVPMAADVREAGR